MRQHIWGEVLDFIPAFLHFIFECKSERTVKIGARLSSYGKNNSGTVFYEPQFFYGSQCIYYEMNVTLLSFVKTQTVVVTICRIFVCRVYSLLLVAYLYPCFILSIHLFDYLAWLFILSIQQCTSIVCSRSTAVRFTWWQECRKNVNKSIFDLLVMITAYHLEMFFRYLLMIFVESMQNNDDKQPSFKHKPGPKSFGRRHRAHSCEHVIWGKGKSYGVGDGTVG